LLLSVAQKKVQIKEEQAKSPGKKGSEGEEETKSEK